MDVPQVGAFQQCLWYRTRLPMQETRFPSLVQEDPLEPEMATYSSIPFGIISWVKEPVASKGSQRVGHD